MFEVETLRNWQLEEQSPEQRAGGSCCTGNSTNNAVAQDA